MGLDATKTNNPYQRQYNPKLGTKIMNAWGTLVEPQTKGLEPLP